jgi:hypothetical protein
MSRKSVLTIGAFLLLVLGIYMIYFGTTKNMIPPTVTGAGFIIIAAVFWKL